MVRRVARFDAPDVARVLKYSRPTPKSQETAIEINGKELELPEWNQSDIVSQFNSSSFPEFREVRASASGDDVLFTAATPGNDFDMSARIGGAPSVTLQRVQEFIDEATCELTKTQSYVAPHVGTSVTCDLTKTQSYSAATQQSFRLIVPDSYSSGQYYLNDNGNVSLNISHDAPTTEIELDLGDRGEDTSRFFFVSDSADSGSWTEDFEGDWIASTDLKFGTDPSVGFVRLTGNASLSTDAFTNTVLSLKANSNQSGGTLRIRAVTDYPQTSPPVTLNNQGVITESTQTTAFYDWMIPATTSGVTYSTPAGALDSVISEALNGTSRTTVLLTFELIGSGSVRFENGYSGSTNKLTGTLPVVDNWTVIQETAQAGEFRRYLLTRNSGTGTLTIENYTLSEAPTVTEVTSGSSGQGEVYELEISNAASGALTMTSGGDSQSHSSDPWGMTTTELETLIESISGIDADSITATLDGNTYTINVNQSQGEINLTHSHTLVSNDPSTPGQGEVYELEIDNAGSGTLTLTSGDDSQSLTSEDWSTVTASQIDTLTESIDGIDTDSVSVTHSGSTFTINVDVSQGEIGLSHSHTILASGETQAAQPEKWELKFTNRPNGGTLTLTDGSNTGVISFPGSISFPAMETGIADATGLTTNDITVEYSDSEDIYLDHFTVTFPQSLGSVTLSVSDDSMQSAGEQSVTLTEVTRSSGKFHFDDPLNWKPEGVPESGDVIVIERGDNQDAMKYGLVQRCVVTVNSSNDKLTFTESSFRDDQKVTFSTSGTSPGGLADGNDYYVTNLDRTNKTLQLSATLGGDAIDLTSSGTGTHTIDIKPEGLVTHAQFSGEIGLGMYSESDYREYRPIDLRIGIQSLSSVQLGIGQGSGTRRTRIDFGEDEASVEVFKTGSRRESNVPVVLILCQNENFTLTNHDGDVGLGFDEGTTSKASKLELLGGELECGEVTIGKTDQVATIKQVDGSVKFRDAEIFADWVV